MKVKFFVYEISSANKEHTGHVRGSLLDSQKRGEFFEKYLLSALHLDFPEYAPNLLDDVLAAVKRIEAHEIDSHEYEGQGFTHTINRDGVRFEHTIFGECLDWPIWHCTLAQYKAALEGYRQFCAMPKSIDSELVVDLPDIDPGLKLVK